jgi:hypothetical protein
MATLNQPNAITLALVAGDVLTVTTDAASSGSVTRLAASAGGEPQSYAELGASETQTFGPYTTPQRFEARASSGSLTHSTAPADLTALKLGTGTEIEAAPTRAGAGSFQPIAVDLNLDADAGTSEAGDTDFLAPIMGNLLGDGLTQESNYLAGLIGALSVTGARATVLPLAALLGILMDGAVNADAIVQAHIDGGDPSTQTNARAAFGVSQFNNHAATGVDYGLDLRFVPGAEIDALLSGTAEAFKVLKALVRSPNNVCWLEGDGAPVDGTTGDDFAGKGSLYTDYTNGALYLNTGTLTDSVWVEMTQAS